MCLDLSLSVSSTLHLPPSVKPKNLKDLGGGSILDWDGYKTPGHVHGRVLLPFHPFVFNLLPIGKSKLPVQHCQVVKFIALSWRNHLKKFGQKWQRDKEKSVDT